MAREFENGAVVEVVISAHQRVPIGTIGRVVDLHSNRFYLVTFEDLEDHGPFTSWGLHAGNNDTKYTSKTCAWFETGQIKAAEKPRPKVEFETVIMAEDKKQQILEALEQIRNYKLIFDVWGFGETIEKGRGASMLFYGPPGTGKTLMCQAIADKLGKKMTIIATADIESSAPGQSERNIRDAFKAAKKNDAILLFDECDSLLYSRQNVGPIMGAQSNELLAQIEKFEGIILFTTNRLGTLDEAINRRLALKLEIPIPDQQQRVEIWRRMFPKKAPLARGVDWQKLASIPVTGGYIKNAVLRAARMAAIEAIPDENKKIRMKHLVEAIRQEAEALMAFEKARQDNEGRIGQVVVGPNGQRVIGKIGNN